MKDKTSKATSSDGFTLVEIMIVVAIIGLLAAIAIPNYVEARQRAQMTSCINNLHRIDGAIQEWALEAKKQAGQTVTFDDIRGYLRNAIVCPSGGVTFGDSYQITSVDEIPLCLRVPRGKYPHTLAF